MEEMNRYTTRTLIKGSSVVTTQLFFVLITGILLVQVFQGLDLSDAGFYATFYQDIFSHPGSVQYCFVYWLSGIVGGLYLKAFGPLGLLGIRLLGVITCLGTVWFTWRLLRSYLHPTGLMWSLLVLVVFMNNNPKEFYYNNFSALLYVLTAGFLFRGMKKRSILLLCLAGFFVGLNTLNRLPNLLGLGLAGIILIWGIWNKQKAGKVATGILVFLSGFVAALGAGYVVMKTLGHWDIYVHSVSEILSLGTNTSAKIEPDNAYGIMRLLKILMIHYRLSFIYVGFFVVLLLAISSAETFLSKNAMLPKIVARAFMFLLIASGVVLILANMIDYIIIIYFITGITLTVSILILLTEKSRDMILLLLIGCFFAIVHPMGSSEGIHTVIIYSLWIAFPVAFHFLYELSGLENSLLFSFGAQPRKLSLSVDGRQIRQMKAATLGLVLFACARNIWDYPYFDREDRAHMVHPLDNSRLKGILVTQGRADALNELFSASRKYVHEGDSVIVYDCIALYYYATGTIPYARNPWLWLYNAGVFQQKLKEAAKPGGKLPIVVRQTIKTIGSGSGWPETFDTIPYNEIEMNRGRNEIMDQFLATHHYKEVWSNSYFRIYQPGETGNP